MIKVGRNCLPKSWKQYYYKTAITKLLMACVCVVPKAQTKHKGTTSTADDRYTTLSVKTILTKVCLLQT
jgi:hypothetical protein